MKIFKHKMSNFTWTDCEAPTKADLVKLAEEFSIPLHYLTTSLEPEHLVRIEFFEDKCFLILRMYDPHADSMAGTIQELTTKIVFFIGPDFLLTLHRTPNEFIEVQKSKVQIEDLPLKALMKFFCSQVLLSFDQPMTDIENKTNIIEDRIYALKRKNILRKGYLIKRRASSFRKILKFSMDALQKLQSRPDFLWEGFQELKDYNDRMIFYADDVLENITGLLNLHISLMSQKTNEASFRTNEVMRVLTLVSIFFLPLNFIAGIYGMNFKNMPELDTAHGYQYTLLFMALTALGILFWLYRKGWIKKEDIKTPTTKNKTPRRPI